LTDSPGRELVNVGLRIEMEGSEGIGLEPRESGPGDIVAVIPAFNEERFIGSVVLKARRYASTVIVVDDGSTDATAWIAEAAGAKVVRHERNRGKGAALDTGFQAAAEIAPAAVVTLDADFQHRPRELLRLLEPVLAGEADIVVGSRYLEGKGGVPRHRIWGHRVFTWVTNVASGIAVSDSQSGFRAFSPRALEAIGFSSEGFAVESEMQFLAQEHGLRIAEAPVSALYEDGPKRPVVAHGLLVLNGVLRLIGQYRPLLFFGVPGVVLAIVGLGWGIYVVRIYQQAQQLAIGYALISVLLFMLGSLSLFAGIILHSVRALLLDLVRRREGG
jgi:glycosyltransferase involved in cell wall biosynthesis